MSNRQSFNPPTNESWRALEAHFKPDGAKLGEGELLARINRLTADCNAFLLTPFIQRASPCARYSRALKRFVCGHAIEQLLSFRVVVQSLEQPLEAEGKCCQGKYTLQLGYVQPEASETPSQLPGKVSELPANLKPDRLLRLLKTRVEELHHVLQFAWPPCWFQPPPDLQHQFHEECKEFPTLAEVRERLSLSGGKALLEGRAPLHFFVDGSCSAKDRVLQLNTRWPHKLLRGSRSGRVWWYVALSHLLQSREQPEQLNPVQLLTLAVHYLETVFAVGFSLESARNITADEFRELGREARDRIKGWGQTGLRWRSTVIVIDSDLAGTLVPDSGSEDRPRHEIEVLPPTAQPDTVDYSALGITDTFADVRIWSLGRQDPVVQQLGRQALRLCARTTLASTAVWEAIGAAFHHGVGTTRKRDRGDGSGQGPSKQRWRSSGKGRYAR